MSFAAICMYVEYTICRGINYCIRSAHESSNNTTLVTDACFGPCSDGQICYVPASRSGDPKG